MFLGLKWILMQTAMQLLGGTHAEITPLLPILLHCVPAKGVVMGCRVGPAQQAEIVW
jgi:hypothetical protein